MCKTRHEHAANEKTHKPRVHTRHDNMKHTVHEIHKLRATAQDITWMHAADRNTNCVQHNKTHVDRRACGRGNSRPPHSHNDRKRSASVRTPTRNRNSRHECRDPNTTLQHETRYADERAHGSSTLEAVHSHKNRTWREYQGSVTKLWITLDQTDRTLTDYVCFCIDNDTRFHSLFVFPTAFAVPIWTAGCIYKINVGITLHSFIC